jgi:quercetin dioxygenase-like cupin family protein
MTTHQPEYVREHGPMEVAVRQVHLDKETAELKTEPAWKRGDRVAKTLVKEQGLNVVLMLMKAGTTIHEHKTEGPATINCLAGSIDLKAHGETIRLGPGELVAMDGGVSHSVYAKDESALLVTLAN